MPRLQKNTRNFRSEIIISVHTTLIDRVVDQIYREKIPAQITAANKHVYNVNENIYINNNTGSNSISDIIITYYITLHCSNLVSEKKGSGTSLVLRMFHLQTPLIKSKLKKVFLQKSRKLVQDFKQAFDLTLKSVRVW